MTRFYLYAGKAKGRVRVNLSGARSRRTDSKRKAARRREPWLLVSNLPSAYATAKRGVSIYRTRMQIEEKTTAVFQHVYDAYYGAGRSVYAAA